MYFTILILVMKLPKLIHVQILNDYSCTLIVSTLIVLLVYLFFTRRIFLFLLILYYLYIIPFLDISFSLYCILLWFFFWLNIFIFTVFLIALFPHMYVVLLLTHLQSFYFYTCFCRLFFLLVFLPLIKNNNLRGSFLLIFKIIFI